jgi:TRAP-type C4-dicarboxylate transport system permease small subunit
MSENNDRSGFTGATVRTLYVEREVKVFAVHEFEYSSLTNLSTAATVAFSIAGAAFAYAAGIVTNAAFAEKLTPAGELATKLVAPILFLASFIAVCCGGYALLKRRDLWGTIKKQSSGSS